MLREGWNFKNDIGIKLEALANEVLCGNSERPYGKDIDSDNIAAGRFVDVMIEILCYVKTKEDDDIKNYIELSKSYQGKSSLEIGNEMSEKLYNEFFFLF